MVETCDVVIIGAGILGCFAARAFSAYDLKTIVLEKREDVCTMISKANTGIVYAGYDMHPGSLKAEMTVRSNGGFEQLCKELGVTYLKTGSLMVSYGPDGDHSLASKMEQGNQNGVPGMHLISGAQAEELEPNLKKGITSALYSETTGAVNPWDLGIAAYENAKANGVEFHFLEPVTGIQCQDDGVYIRTQSNEYQAKVVVNCAGAHTDTIREMAFAPSVRIRNTSANYLVYEKGSAKQVSHVIFYEPEKNEKGLSIVPTEEGNLIIGATESEQMNCGDYATSTKDLSTLLSFVNTILPSLEQDRLLNQFASVRPNPYLLQDPEVKLNDFNILEDGPMISLMAIKTPGITCAAELGKYIVEKVISMLGPVDKNPHYDPVRKPINHPDIEHYKIEIDGEILCRCNHVTETMVREAIHRGATTLNGVRRRTRAGMGSCQGADCEEKILKILMEELNLKAEQITKDGAGSEVLL
ncbi:MAG: FAD-dependent oxidoreductase [Lachnospiraceae bacterium]|nr:FAD-dependent oxidoreductase [Lachnospiraceae bacterium]